jgi:phage gpG-like protein
MISIEIQLVNFTQVDRGLAAIGRSVSNLTPLFVKIGAEVHAEEKSLFNAAPWAALSDEYAERKLQLFGAKPTLRATDALFRSLTEPDAPDSVYRIKEQSAEFGSSNPVALLHQSGTSRMPARPPRVDIRHGRYVTLAGEYLHESVTKAGFH